MIKELIKYSKNLSVLYVEDEDEIRNELAEVLRDLFHTVDVAKNGREGLACYMAKTYDIVICDVKMPVMDGVEMTIRIRAINKEQPVIVISAYSDTDYMLQFINAGIHHYLLKPLDHELLLETLFKASREIVRERELVRYKSNLEALFKSIRDAIIIVDKKCAVVAANAAAKDITSLITDSVKKAETGKDLVRKTKEVFSGVATQVKKVTDLVSEIAAASDEQKNGVTQISKAIQQMDQAIQQNAANAEETAASSAELSEQAKGLNVLIERVAAEINVGENSAHATMQYAPRSNAVEKRRSIPVVQNRFSPITKSKTGGNGGDGTHKYATLSRNASPQQLIPLDNDGFVDF